MPIAEPDLTDMETILKLIGEEKALQVNKDPAFRPAVLQAYESWLAMMAHERRPKAQPVYESSRPEREAVPVNDYWWNRD